MSHSIDLKTAVEMTTLYRQNRNRILATPFQDQNILCLSESFSREEIDEVLKNEKCVGVRIYYGMTPDLLVHAILVGYDSSNRDILPEVHPGMPGDDPITILEKAVRCPEICPPASPLNP